MIFRFCCLKFDSNFYIKVLVGRQLLIFFVPLDFFLTNILILGQIKMAGLVLALAMYVVSFGGGKCVIQNILFSKAFFLLITQYWLKRLEELDPKNPTIFELKVKTYHSLEEAGNGLKKF